MSKIYKCRPFIGGSFRFSGGCSSRREFPDNCSQNFAVFRLDGFGLLGPVLDYSLGEEKVKHGTEDVNSHGDQETIPPTRRVLNRVISEGKGRRTHSNCQILGNIAGETGQGTETIGETHKDRSITGGDVEVVHIEA